MVLIGKGELFCNGLVPALQSGDKKSSLPFLNRKVTENDVGYAFFLIPFLLFLQTRHNHLLKTSHLTGEGIPQVLKRWTNPSSNSTNEWERSLYLNLDKTILTHQPDAKHDTFFPGAGCVEQAQLLDSCQFSRRCICAPTAKTLLNFSFRSGSPTQSLCLRKLYLCTTYLFFLSENSLPSFPSCLTLTSTCKKISNSAYTDFFIIRHKLFSTFN